MWLEGPQHSQPGVWHPPSVSESYVYLFLIVGQKANAGQAGKVSLSFSSPFAGACKRLQDHKLCDDFQSGFHRSHSSQTALSEVPLHHSCAHCWNTCIRFFGQSGSLLDQFTPTSLIEPLVSQSTISLRYIKWCTSRFSVGTHSISHASVPSWKVYVSYHFYADDIKLFISFKKSEVWSSQELLKFLSAIGERPANNYLQLIP